MSKICAFTKLSDQPLPERLKTDTSFPANCPFSEKENTFVPNPATGDQVDPPLTLTAASAPNRPQRMLSPIIAAVVEYNWF